MARHILRLLKQHDGPMKADQLAILCDKPDGADGGFRGLLGEMRRRNSPLIRKVHGGYELATAGRAILDAEGEAESG